MVVGDGFDDAAAEILLLLRLQVPESRILRHVVDHHPVLLRGRHGRCLAHHPFMQATAAAALPTSRARRRKWGGNRLPERPRAPTGDEAEQHRVPAEHWLVPDRVPVLEPLGFGVGVVGGGGGGGGGRRGEGVGVEVELGVGAAVLLWAFLQFELFVLDFVSGDTSRTGGVRRFLAVFVIFLCIFFVGATAVCRLPAFDRLLRG